MDQKIDPQQQQPQQYQQQPQFQQQYQQPQQFQQQPQQFQQQPQQHFQQQHAPQQQHFQQQQQPQPQPQQPQHQQQFQQHQQPQQPQQHVVHHNAQHGTNQQGGPLDPRSKDWNFGLFDCFADVEASLIGWILPCMLFGQTMDRMQDPTLQSHDPLNTECMIFGGIQCFTCCGWVYNMVKRTEIRERYGIEGSGGSDCGVSFCCLCCALVQQDREVALRTGGATAAPITQGYQPQTQGMTMQPQQHQQQQQHQHQHPQYQMQPQQQYQAQQYHPTPVHSPPPQQPTPVQSPMHAGVQSVQEQQMPTYPHDAQKQ